MSLGPELIKVGCYNILADGWLDACKPMFLGCWEKRKNELAGRIINLDLDVICLQEVDRFNDLAHVMWGKGYTGYRVDGKDVAIFFRTKRFTVLKKEELHYHDPLWRSALLLQLQSTSGHATFNIISTHVTWKEKYDIQEMGELQAFVDKRRSIPTIVCGDLNATPQWMGISNLCSLGFRDALKHTSKKTYIDENRRLDYILVPDSLHVKQADIPGICANLKTKDEPSDHLPITAQILIPSALQTNNNEKPNTLPFFLFESLNNALRFQEVSQEDYNKVSALFKSALDTVRGKEEAVLMSALLQELSDPLMMRAVRSYEREILIQAISLLQKEQKSSALHLIAGLSEESKQAIYFSLYEIEKRNGRNISHPNFGGAAFHSFDNLDTSNSIRVQAIERSLLRQILAFFKEGQEHVAMPLFERLSEYPIRNAVYGETYAISKQKSLANAHSDFGKVAFHRIEMNDVPNEVRVEAIASYLEKTTV